MWGTAKAVLEGNDYIKNEGGFQVSKIVSYYKDLEKDQNKLKIGGKQ